MADRMDRLRHGGRHCVFWRAYLIACLLPMCVMCAWTRFLWHGCSVPGLACWFAVSVARIMHVYFVFTQQHAHACICPLLLWCLILPHCGHLAFSAKQDVPAFVAATYTPSIHHCTTFCLPCLYKRLLLPDDSAASTPARAEIRLCRCRLSSSSLAGYRSAPRCPLKHTGGSPLFLPYARTTYCRPPRPSRLLTTYLHTAA